MTAKEKAKQLVDKYYKAGNEVFLIDINVAKQCASIACDELIKEFEHLSWKEHGVKTVDYGQGFWNEVKKEIELL